MTRKELTQYVELNWESAARPLLEDIPGNECAKRGLEVALCGSHVAAFIAIGGGPWAEQLVGVGAAIADRLRIPFKAYITTLCPCGNFADAKSECMCKPKTVADHMRKMYHRVSDAVVFVEVVRPRVRDFELAPRQRMAEAQMAARVSEARARMRAEPIPWESGAAELRRMAVSELGTRYAELTAVAGTVALMERSPVVFAQHAAEAAQWTRSILGQVAPEFKKVEVKHD